MSIVTKWYNYKINCCSLMQCCLVFPCTLSRRKVRISITHFSVHFHTGIGIQFLSVRHLSISNYRQTGMLNIGPANCDRLHMYRKSLQDSKAPHEWLSYRQLRMRYPQFQLPPNFVGLLDSSGGVLKAERALQALQVSESIVSTHMGPVFSFFVCFCFLNTWACWWSNLCV